MQATSSVEQAQNLQFESPIIQALLVDDNEFDRKHIKRLSDKTDLKIQISEASSILEMTRSLKAKRFDLVLLDYNLEDGDGLQALDLLQCNGFYDATGVVMITGNGKTDVAVNAFRKGCHDFVTKDGLSAEKIKEAILRSLAGARSAKSPVDLQLKSLIAESVEGSLKNSGVIHRIVWEAKKAEEKLASGTAHFIEYLDDGDDDPFEFRN